MSAAPLCPRCGEPARVVVMQKARVRCRLDADGQIGAVLSTFSDLSAATRAYECGGGHVFRSTEELDIGPADSFGGRERQLIDAQVRALQFVRNLTPNAIERVINDLRSGKARL